MSTAGILLTCIMSLAVIGVTLIAAFLAQLVVTSAKPACRQLTCKQRHAGEDDGDGAADRWLHASSGLQLLPWL